MNKGTATAKKGKAVARAFFISLVKKGGDAHNESKSASRLGAAQKLICIVWTDALTERRMK